MKATGPKSVAVMEPIFSTIFCRNSLEVEKGEKSLYGNNCYLYKGTALDISKCEASR